jgi:hypothetical protein
MHIHIQVLDRKKKHIQVEVITQSTVPCVADCPGCMFSESGGGVIWLQRGGVALAGGDRLPV